MTDEVDDNDEQLEEWVEQPAVHQPAGRNFPHFPAKLKNSRQKLFRATNQILPA